MKYLIPFCVFAVISLVAASAAQAQWECVYATYDDPDSNGTGSNTVAVGVIKEDMFIALVNSVGSDLITTENFMIPYVDASAGVGRKYSYGYGGDATGVFQVWTDGLFDQVTLYGASQLKATPDSLIYLANNDPDHNILVFKYENDTVTVPPPFYRQPTGSNGIWGIDVDMNGYVYVCNDTSMGVSDDVKIYDPVSQWGPAHADIPVTTLDLPDGVYKGICVTPDGSQLFVTDHGNKRILKYVGSPTSGYAQDNGFSYEVSLADTIPLAPPVVRASVIGLGYLASNNILFVACDTLFGRPGRSYQYARIYLLNPNTGALVSTDSSVSVIDVAKWNFTLTGTYSNRPGGKVPLNASGYTSTYDVKFDENGNLYSQSYYGWTVEKWHYLGTLPTVTSVERLEGRVPEAYELSQNYPNPFNPVTTIDFSLSNADFVTLKVYNLLGQEVATLVRGEKQAGNYRVTFDANDLPSGTYMYVLRSGTFSEMKKMILLK
jgi:hypothetical protein